MSAIITLPQFKNLRDRFREYLSGNNPGWKEKTVNTVVSDSFYALNNNVGVDFWESLSNEETLHNARDKIRDYLVATGAPGNPESRADEYMKALRQLKTFIDEEHPGLPEEWGGKEIRDVNLREEFREWMRGKVARDPHSGGIDEVAGCVAALEKIGEKMNLGEEYGPNLFYYFSVEEFDEVRGKIMEAIGPAEGVREEEKRFLINYLSSYRQFLEESGRPYCWIFQGNPAYYDIKGALGSLEKITWAVNQYRKQIKKSDRAYIWISGPDGGIAAAGTVLCDPETRAPDPGDPFLKGAPLKREPYLAVDIRIDRKFDEIIPRTVLLADQRTKKLEILTFPGATNFRVTKRQEDVIESVLDGSYAAVTTEDPDSESLVEKKRWWLYAPGEAAKFWDEFREEGIMGIGWDEIGSLIQYRSKEEMKAAMQKVWGEGKSFMHDGLAVWQFAREIKPGDVVFAKKGIKYIVGRGVVASDYYFDESRQEYKHLRKVEWRQSGEWEYPGNPVVKTLTDLTSQTGIIEQLETQITDEPRGPEGNIYPKYTEQDFLGEVYMSPERYHDLKSLLLHKKNIILQGAPGVGKTFVARRLAYSIMGKKDAGRVYVVQFHQSFSYEDFVMGYRPCETGFKLETGPFYDFCKKALDDDREHFFIIDEINRGNLSKIFGELLMLIEGDKRGESHAVRPVYSDEQFWVPENVYLIGMMNTADRSLALIDYALRRRFAFFDMVPGFSSEGFREHQVKMQNRKFDALIDTVEALNKEIEADAALGAGFRVGHSFFCAPGADMDRWLDQVVEYELLPLLNEYWFDEPSKVDKWGHLLRKAISG